MSVTERTFVVTREYLINASFVLRYHRVQAIKRDLIEGLLSDIW